MVRPDDVRFAVGRGVARAAALSRVDGVDDLEPRAALGVASPLREAGQRDEVSGRAGCHGRGWADGRGGRWRHRCG